jgi:disulfide bond formation protein DsbB
MEDVRKQMETTRIIRCDEVSLRILGLSLADWNVLVSAGIALVAALGATAPKKS